MPNGLLGLRRAELNEIAAREGVSGADALPNKGAVVTAIRAARAARGPLQRALAEALADMELIAADAAAVQLARTYAAQIDQGTPLMHVGGQFRDLLVELGLTPKARAALTKGEPQQPAGANPLDELRARREAKARGPQA